MIRRAACHHRRFPCPFSATASPFLCTLLATSRLPRSIRDSPRCSIILLPAWHPPFAPTHWAYIKYLCPRVIAVPSTVFQSPSPTLGMAAFPPTGLSLGAPYRLSMAWPVCVLGSPTWHIPVEPSWSAWVIERCLPGCMLFPLSGTCRSHLCLGRKMRDCWSRSVNTLHLHSARTPHAHRWFCFPAATRAPTPRPPLDAPKGRTLAPCAAGDLMPTAMYSTAA